MLHADPHPGNLLRTADGKICILDFGLMTEVAPERRIALVEYISHLSVQDWGGVAKDLVNLGFTPEGRPFFYLLMSSSSRTCPAWMRAVCKKWTLGHQCMVSSLLPVQDAGIFHD